MPRATCLPSRRLPSGAQSIATRCKWLKGGRGAGQARWRARGLRWAPAGRGGHLPVPYGRRRITNPTLVHLVSRYDLANALTRAMARASRSSLGRGHIERQPSLAVAWSGEAVRSAAAERTRTRTRFMWVSHACAHRPSRPCPTPVSGFCRVCGTLVSPRFKSKAFSYCTHALDTHMAKARQSAAMALVSALPSASRRSTTTRTSL